MIRTMFLTVIFLGLLVSCGGKDGGGSDSNPLVTEAEEAGDGVYHAHLRPVNAHASGFIPHGGATFSLEGDRLTVKSYLDDASSVEHRQSVHVGTKCPGPEADKNGDGFIDYPEALAYVGPVLIPLDSDLSEQQKGADSYPRGSAFTYQESVSLSQLMGDLWSSDIDPADEVIKLPPSEGLKLVGRVVLVFGTSPYSGLPATLGGRGSVAPYLSLPVTCGVITPVL